MAKLKIKHLQSNVYTTTNGAASNGTARAANVVVDLGYSRGVADANGNVILNTIGVVGGEAGITADEYANGSSNVIQCIARIPTLTKNAATGITTWDSNVSGTVITDGYIVRQKGKHKFIVGSAGNASIIPALCQLVNISNATANAINNLSTSNSNVEIPIGYMAIQAVDAGGSNVAVYTVTDKQIYGFPPAYSDPTEANNNPAGNIYSTSTAVFYGSYGNATATVQPGPGSGAGTATANGLFQIANVQNQA